MDQTAQLIYDYVHSQTWRGFTFHCMRRCDDYQVIDELGQTVDSIDIDVTFAGSNSRKVLCSLNISQGSTLIKAFGNRWVKLDLSDPLSLEKLKRYLICEAETACYNLKWRQTCQKDLKLS